MNQEAVVVDASVAVKWVVMESHTIQARALLLACSEHLRPIVGPPHFAGEVANALLQRTRSRELARRLSSSEAQRALQTFLSVTIEQRAPAGIYDDAYQFAVELNLPTVYDSLYVVLARMLGAELWTADQRLINALGSSAPWVRFIGDYPLA